MARFPTIEEFAKETAEKVLDDFGYQGKTIREWATQIVNGDLVPVVRCKDCKHYDNTEGIQWCSLNSKFAQWGMDWHSFPEDGFCSYGERRTDGKID